MSLIPAQQSTPFTDFGNTIFQTAYGDTLLTISPDATLTLENTNTGNIMTFSSDNFDYNGTSVNYSRLNALRAVCPSVNPTILGVNNTISLQNNDVIGSATHIINFSSGDPANIGEHFGIEYYSTTNDDFVLSSSTSGSLVYKQISGTTDELRLNPQQVYLYNNVTLTNEYLDITKSRIYMENKLGGGGNETLISIDCEDGTGHPRESITLYENSTIIRDDYIKIGNKSYNTAINSGDLYCNNVQLNTINGLSPTTIGLTWANFTATNAYNNLPASNSYALDDSAGNVSTFSATSLTFNSSVSNNIISNNGGTDLTIQSSNQLILTAVGGAVGINAGSNISLNPTTTGDINLDAPNINSFGYAMPICFTRERNDSFTYSFGGQNMENVYNATIAVPYQFFTEQPQGNYTSTKWKIDFALNCYSNSNVGDKGLALYFDFQDITTTFTFKPNTYNDNTPYAVYQPSSNYTSSGNAPFQNFNWTDWCDFGALQGQTSSVLPLNMRLYFAGDTTFSCSFYMAITLTRTNMI